MKFKISDEVRVIADEVRLGEICLSRAVSGEMGIIKQCNEDSGNYYIYFESLGNSWTLEDQDLELAYKAVSAETESAPAEPDCTFAGHPDGGLEVKWITKGEPQKWQAGGGTSPPIRTFAGHPDGGLEVTNDPTIPNKLFGHPRFYEILEQMKELHSRKNHDYAGTSDPLKNLRACKRLELTPFMGVMVRLQDKWSRLEEFVKSGKLMVKNESVIDTLMDNAVYSVLAIILYEEQQKEDV